MLRPDRTPWGESTINWTERDWTWFDSYKQTNSGIPGPRRVDYVAVDDILTDGNIHYTGEAIRAKLLNAGYEIVGRMHA